MPLMRDAGGGVIVNVSTYAPDITGESLNVAAGAYMRT